MSFTKKLWIKFLKAVFCTCGEATFLLAKKECTELPLVEQIKLKLHLWKCKYCKWYVEEQKLLSRSIENMDHRLEGNNYVYHLTPEQKQRIKKAINEA